MTKEDEVDEPDEVDERNEIVEKLPIDNYYNIIIYCLIPLWFSFIIGILIMWCVLRYIIFRDYYDKMNNPNKYFDLSIKEPSNLEYYLYLLGIPLGISIIISITI